MDIAYARMLMVRELRRAANLMERPDCQTAGKETAMRLVSELAVSLCAITELIDDNVLPVRESIAPVHFTRIGVC